MSNTLYKLVPALKNPGVFLVYKKYWFGWFYYTAIADYEKDRFLAWVKRETETYQNGERI